MLRLLKVSGTCLGETLGRKNSYFVISQSPSRGRKATKATGATWKPRGHAGLRWCLGAESSLNLGQERETSRLLPAAPRKPGRWQRPSPCLQGSGRRVALTIHGRRPLACRLGHGRLLPPRPVQILSRPPAPPPLPGAPHRTAPWAAGVRAREVSGQRPGSLCPRPALGFPCPLLTGDLRWALRCPARGASALRDICHRPYLLFQKLPGP